MIPLDPLHAHLERLYDATDGPARLRHDPVAFVHRYHDPHDIEIAALIAVSLAYGRVDLFFPVLEALFDHLDAHGGPRAVVETFDRQREAALLPLVYRWNRGRDFVLLLDALGRVVASHGTLEAAFVGEGAEDRLTAGVDVLRSASLEAAAGAGTSVASFSELPRGLRYILPSPRSGSACKRWNLFLRWLVRPPLEGVDRGTWTTWHPRELIMPLDVHVHRISRFLGLTTRKDTSWRTAEAITDRLRAFDPDDPVRFDFAIAHLGISKACTGRRDPTVCPACPLDPVCKAP